MTWSWAGVVLGWVALFVVLTIRHLARASTHRHCDLCGFPVWGSRSMLEHYEDDCRMPGHARDKAKFLRDTLAAGRSL